MDRLDEFCYWLEELPLAITIGETWLFPLMESIHVIAAVFVLGSIVIADLRLLGWLGKSQPVLPLIRESILWTWLAFAVALVTGLAMFITRATGYVYNPAFIWKLILLVLAGINMLYFHRRLYPQIASLSNQSQMPAMYRVSGAISLCLWLGVMLAGRWIGHIF